ncbi:MAG: VanW family protein, partial [Deltaproteobacteria bacterium]|nr:VanW family protein [Deltaproteobacteria bacterium]
GKLTNVSLAAQAFDGLVLVPGEPLSFWRTLGRVTEARGFVNGLSISGGCLMPALGGGLCLLSNALFELAVRLGFTIVERHGHSQEAVPPRPGALWGLDATVFWPYVDLRSMPVYAPVQLGVSVSHEERTLRVSVRSQRPMRERVELTSEGERVLDTPVGPVRGNRVRRRTFSLETGALLDDRVVAENHRRVLSPEQMGRTCYTCGEESCHRRVEPER